MSGQLGSAVRFRVGRIFTALLFIASLMLVGVIDDTSGSRHLVAVHRPPPLWCACDVLLWQIRPRSVLVRGCPPDCKSLLRWPVFFLERGRVLRVPLLKTVAEGPPINTHALCLCCALLSNCSVCVDLPVAQRAVSADGLLGLPGRLQRCVRAAHGVQACGRRLLVERVLDVPVPLNVRTRCLPATIHH